MDDDVRADAQMDKQARNVERPRGSAANRGPDRVASRPAPARIRESCSPPSPAMYCAPIGSRSFGGNSADQQFPVRANKSGSVVYQPVAGAGCEPSATLVSSALHPNWFAVSANGDLSFQSKSPTGAQGVNLTEKLPADGLAAVTVTGEHTAYAIAGAPSPRR